MTIWEVRTGRPNKRQAKAGHTCNASSLYSTREAALDYARMHRLRNPDDPITVAPYEWGHK